MLVVLSDGPLSDLATISTCLHIFRASLQQTILSPPGPVAPSVAVVHMDVSGAGSPIHAMIMHMQYTAPTVGTRLTCPTSKDPDSISVNVALIDEMTHRSWCWSLFCDSVNATCSSNTTERSEKFYILIGRARRRRLALAAPVGWLMHIVRIIRRSLPCPSCRLSSRSVGTGKLINPCGSALRVHGGIGEWCIGSFVASRYGRYSIYGVTGSAIPAYCGPSASQVWVWVCVRDPPSL